jgi:hypothetical protein
VQEWMGLSAESSKTGRGEGAQSSKLKAQRRDVALSVDGCLGEVHWTPGSERFLAKDAKVHAKAQIPHFQTPTLLHSLISSTPKGSRGDHSEGLDVRG